MLKNTKYVFLGERVIIRDGARFDIVTEYMGRQYNPKVIIGDGALFEQSFHLSCADCIEIGSKVTFARGVSVLGIWHEYSDIAMPVIDQAIGVAHVSIGDGTLVGAGAVIMPGVTIGKQCVIGANSVVTKNIPDYSIAAGIPAKIVKQYDHNSDKWLSVDKA